jgi:hypothetical protein
MSPTLVGSSPSEDQGSTKPAQATLTREDLDPLGNGDVLAGGDHHAALDEQGPVLDLFSGTDDQALGSNGERRRFLAIQGLEERSEAVAGRGR